MKTATLIDCPELVGRGTGEMRLYKLSPAIKATSYGDDSEMEIEYAYVVVSAAYAMGMPETYIFPADSNGEILSWSELEGSFQGAFDHERALENAGYVVQ